ncbi:DUF402 domain-containing protein [Nocardia arthritidis]|uniref:DUF402 domain-containing protein n=1 Tax=Nocardia arthritidis TaxID=228602 RepID=A0A6G9YDI5_9NOCA|nr:DUF402 domain-containing protein [Nocardia arthritidis]QIS11116.1 DUF402 domain-containing protein [Nocardia arthritidis]
MSALLPLLVAAPAVTGIAGFVARDIRGIAFAHGTIATNGSNGAAAPPGRTPTRPRVEYFNVAEFTNTDAKGFVRPVERFHVEPWGLYMARCVDGPQFHYLESWLLPDLSIRATIAHRHAGDHHGRDYCLDIGEYTRIEPKRWKAVDHYLDIEVQGGRRADLRGVDELLAAHAAGVVDTAQAHRAFERATAAMDGLAAHDHDVERWLAAQGIGLTWM